MYVVLFGLVILVFSSILPRTSSGAKGPASPEVMKDMEETMEGFLAELEEDNQKLMESIASMKQEHEKALHKLSARLENVEGRLNEQRQEINRLAARQEAEQLERMKEPVAALTKPASKHAHTETYQESAPIPAEVEVPAPLTIKSRYQELFQMYAEGKSVEYIAKKTGMNKGEVSLIIQLSEQEDRKGAEK